MYKKLKSLIANDLVFTSLLLCCVAVTAFILGRSSVLSAPSQGTLQAPSVRQTAGLTTVSPAPTADPTESTSASQSSAGQDSGPIVASKSGTKYHLVSCPGAKQIKEENRVYFGSGEEAQAAGYSKAANCPGL